MQYCYNNQDIKSIKNLISPYNIFTLLELSHCLSIKSLKLYIEKFIIEKYIDNNNIVKLCLESKFFELEKLYNECFNRIIKNFNVISNNIPDLLELDYDTFKK